MQDCRFCFIALNGLLCISNNRHTAKRQAIVIYGEVEKRDKKVLTKGCSSDIINKLTR